MTVFQTLIKNKESGNPCVVTLMHNSGEDGYNFNQPHLIQIPFRIALLIFIRYNVINNALFLTILINREEQDYGNSKQDASL